MLRFSFLRHTSVQTFRIRKLNGGINTTDRPQNISDGQLSDSVNMWFSDGVLKTRPGICADKSSIISGAAEYNAAGEISFGGEEYAVITYREDSARFKLFFMSRKGTLDAGKLCLKSQPERLFFYSAGGIFSAAVFGEKISFYSFCETDKSWRICAELKLAYTAESIISLGEKVFLAAGNGLYAAKLSAPSEFEKVCEVGGTEKITGLLKYEEKLIIFKQSSLFIIDPKNGIITTLSDNIGCESVETAVICGGYPVWLNRKNEVSILTDKVISIPSGLLNGLGSKRRAVSFGKCYLLISGEKAVIMDCENIGSIRWYYWSFQGLSPICGIPGSGMAVLNSSSDACFAACFSGETDTDMLASGDVVCKKIKCCCTTKYFDFGISEKKYIENIFLSVAAKGQIWVRINGKSSERINLGLPDLDNGCGTFKSVRLIPHLHAVKSVYITLEADDVFSLDEIMIYFRNAGL